MKMFGSWSRLVSVMFRQNNHNIHLESHAQTTYTADRTVLLPAVDDNCVLISEGQVSATYLSQADAQSTYLSQSDASSTYLTQSDASSTYLSQSSAASTYLSQSDAASTYLSQSDAASTYQALNGNLSALSGLSTDGLIVKTADGEAVTREIEGVAPIVVDYGDGVGGNPAVSLSIANAALKVAPVIGDSMLIGDSQDSDLVKKISLAQLAELIGPGAYGHAADWATGTTVQIVHNLNSMDVMVQLYDKFDGATIYVDSVVRVDSNTIELTASEAPSGSGWRVMVQKIV